MVRRTASVPGCETGRVRQLAFDEETGKQLEALYRIILGALS